MTRRVFNPQPHSHMPGMWRWQGAIRGGHGSFQASTVGMADSLATHAVRYAVGDRLYVREALRAESNDQGKRWWSYAADGKDVWPLTEWHKARDSVPSIHMPRWASRITLIVTDVRVQRVQDISEADAIAEGCPGTLGPDPEFPDEWDPSPVEEYRALWDGLNAKRGYGWDENPWVAAYSFRPVHGNIDDLGGGRDQLAASKGSA
jgi:hypothetical protein